MGGAGVGCLVWGMGSGQNLDLWKGRWENGDNETRPEAAVGTKACPLEDINPRA